MQGPDAISFARPGRARYEHDIKQFGESKLTKPGHNRTRKQIDWKLICNDLRVSSNGP